MLLFRKLFQLDLARQGITMKSTNQMPGRNGKPTRYRGIDLFFGYVDYGGRESWRWRVNAMQAMVMMIYLGPKKSSSGPDYPIQSLPLMYALRMKSLRVEIDHVLKTKKSPLESYLSVPVLLFFVQHEPRNTENAEEESSEECYTMDEMMKEMDLHTLMGDLHWNAVACKMKSGEGVHEGLEWLVQQVELVQQGQT